MKKLLRRMLVILLALVFVGSSAVVLRQLYEQRLAEQAYQAAAEIALTASDPVSWESAVAVQEPLVPLPQEQQPEPEEIPEPQLPLTEEPEEAVQEPLPEEAELLLEVDLNVLREINADVLGWIHIPDTVISYPLMRSKDNQEYLELTWDLKRSAAGSIFLERKSSTDLSDFHTLIYGHNMKNDSMFGQLHEYRDQAFTESHPCVYIVKDDVVLRYEVFAAYTADVKSDTYRLYFEGEDRKQSAIDFYLEQSEIKSELVPTAEDRLLTLSTCTGLGDYNYRWVVQTVLTGRFPR